MGKIQDNYTKIPYSILENQILSKCVIESVHRLIYIWGYERNSY